MRGIYGFCGITQDRRIFNYKKIFKKREIFFSSIHGKGTSNENVIYGFLCHNSRSHDYEKILKKDKKDIFLFVEKLL